MIPERVNSFFGEHHLARPWPKEENGLEGRMLAYRNTYERLNAITTYLHYSSLYIIQMFLFCLPPCCDMHDSIVLLFFARKVIFLLALPLSYVSQILYPLINKKNLQEKLLSNIL